jgi:hypothetical protein
MKNISNKLKLSFVMASLIIGTSNLLGSEILVAENNVSTSIREYSSGMGQSILNWESGDSLSAISIVSDSAVDSVTLVVYDNINTNCNLAADGGGNPIASKSINLTDTYTDNTNYTFQKIALDTPVVINSTSFKFCLDKQDTALRLSEDTGQNYAEGKPYHQSSAWSGFDFTFQVYKQQINEAPTIDTNKELIVAKDTTSQITSEYLNSSDVDDDADNISYKITSFPAQGTLVKQGNIGKVAFPLNETFTQTQLSNLYYITYDTTPIGDYTFDFELSDGGEDGVQPVKGPFKIKIVNPTVSYSNSLKEKIDNDGSVEGTLEMTMLGGTFTDADPSTYISMTNIPQGFGGLSANFTRNSDTNITLNFTGNAQHHVGSNGFTGFDLTFSDSAFVGLDASDVIDSSETNLTISFFDGILNVEPNKWNMVSFGDGHEVDTTKLNRTYITDAKDIKAFRDGKFVTTASDIGKYEGVWIHPNTDKVPYIVNKFSNPSTKDDQLAYYKSLEGNKWHLVGVPYQLDWSDLVKDNITPNECQSSFFKYYDAANDSYNSTANIPAKSGMWIRHNCKGEN